MFKFFSYCFKSHATTKLWKHVIALHWVWLAQLNLIECRVNVKPSETRLLDALTGYFKYRYLKKLNFSPVCQVYYFSVKWKNNNPMNILSGYPMNIAILAVFFGG